jgi:hypothetical protein
MTIIAFRAAQTTRKPMISAQSVTTGIAAAASILVGLAAVAAGNATHRDWQSVLVHYTAQPAKAAPAPHAAPAAVNFGV